MKSFFTEGMRKLIVGDDLYLKEVKDYLDSNNIVRDLIYCTYLKPVVKGGKEKFEDNNGLLIFDNKELVFIWGNKPIKEKFRINYEDIFKTELGEKDSLTKALDKISRSSKHRESIVISYQTSNITISGSGIYLIKNKEFSQYLASNKNIDSYFSEKSPEITKKCGKNIDSQEFYEIFRKKIEEGKKRVKGDKVKVTIKVDFSFLKDLMIKKGVQVGKINCPNCGAPVEIPESGRVFTCQYCNTAVTAVDVFKELQDLFKGILPENVKIENGAGKIFCPNCGNLIPEDSEFCPNCGEKV